MEKTLVNLTAGLHQNRFGMQVVVEQNRDNVVAPYITKTFFEPAEAIEFGEFLIALGNQAYAEDEVVSGTPKAP
jgi:hypothetical protein